MVLVRDPSATNQPWLPRSPDLVVWTKADLRLAATIPREEISVSSTTGAGLDTVRNRLGALAFSTDRGDTLTLTARQADLLAAAAAALARVPDATEGGAELAAHELRAALDALGGIRGVVTPDDVLGRVFAGFCVGK